MDSHGLLYDPPSPRRQLAIAGTFASLGALCFLPAWQLCNFASARTNVQLEAMNYSVNTWTVACSIYAAVAMMYLLRAIRSAWFETDPM